MYSNDQAVSLLHSYNKKVIFNYIRVHEYISRTELSQKLGMSATAITRLVNDFIEAGMVKEVGIVDVDSVGRKPIMLSVCKECMYALGVNIDVDELAMGCINMNGEMVYIATVQDFDAHDPEDTVRHISELYHDVIAHLPQDTRTHIIGMGVCVPGLVDWPEGHTRVTPQLHWKPFALRERLRSLLGIEVLVDNNVKGIATAESMFGGKREFDNFFVLEVGSGLGAAYVLDGKVLRGSNGILGEIGHSLAVENGEECDCGRRGCLQAYTCITGLEKRLGMPIARIMELRKTDERVVRILDEAVNALGVTVANIVNFYNPGSIIIYGRLFRIWPELFERLEARSRQLLWSPARLDIQMQKSDIQSENMRVLAAASVFFSDILLPEVVIRQSALNTEKRH